MSAPERILLSDGSYIERSVRPFTNSRSKNKGKIRYKREWWRVHRKGVNRDWELKESLGKEYRVYVLELEKEVYGEKKFRERNKEYQLADGKPTVYVGQTSKTVEERSADHRSGHLSSPLVREFFKRAMPEEYQHLKVCRTEKKALWLEQETADRLRSKGWGVWEGKTEKIQVDNS